MGRPGSSPELKVTTFGMATDELRELQHLLKQSGLTLTATSDLGDYVLSDPSVMKKSGLMARLLDTLSSIVDDWNGFTATVVIERRDIASVAISTRS